ncbi:hypothetical protein ALC62_11004, partial [Cyphomyrmex costatus]
TTTTTTTLRIFIPRRFPTSHTIIFGDRWVAFPSIEKQ